MKNFNIEFNHFYNDEIYNNKHNIIYKNIVENLIKKERIHFTDIKTYILIDNYNTKNINKDFNLENIIEFYKNDNIDIDNVYYERDMTMIANDIIEEIGKEKKNKIYFNNILLYDYEIHKYSCQFLTTIWYMKRLGYISNNLGIITANKIINILDKKYINVENKTLKICNFFDIDSKIENIYV